MSAGDISALVLSLREGVEMALVVGIVLAYLGQVGARGARKWVWAGALAAAVVSLLALGILNALNAELEGTTEQIFEGTTMLLATVFLTWMIFWMLRNSRYLKAELQRGVQGVLERGGAAWGLFFLVFFAMVREGVELALLLFAAPGEGKLVGSLIGLTLAIAVGILIYAFGRRVDLRTFFKVTTVILILFAAGLFARAAHEFAESGALAAIEGPKLWSTAAFLPDDSGLGAVLRAFLGYQDEPTALEVVAYLGYFLVVWLLSKTNLTRQPVLRPQPDTRTA